MMKRFAHFLVLALAALMLTACPEPIDGPDGPSGTDESWRNQASATKLSGITYQLNVYSFADSDGDGWGDIKGVTQHLDYLDSLGATALWLSPIHEAMSYHGYNVNDYTTVSAKLGTEADLKDLIAKAKAKNIGIYLDFVLNHSGSDNVWFKAARGDASSPYRDYYVFSDNPTADVAAGKIDNYAGATSPGMGQWYAVSSGNIGYTGRLHFKLDWSKKTVTVTQTTDAAQSSNGSASKSQSDYTSNNLELTSEYKNTFGAHRIDAIVGYSYNYNVGSSFYAGNGNFPTEVYLYNNLSAGTYLKDKDNPRGSLGSNKYDDKLIGFFVGQCMKAMRGQGNPKLINELLAQKLV